MKNYTFIGKVMPYFPKRVSYPVVPSANPQKKGTFGFEIEKSIVRAELTADHLENTETALKSAEQTIQGLVDAQSFIDGDTFEVRLEVVTVDNGEPMVFKEQSLKGILTALPPEEIPDTAGLMGAAVEYMHLRLALNNFKNAKRYTAYVGLHVYLTIENIKKFFYPIDLKNESKEWEGLREKLSLTREEIEFAKDLADINRHGNYQDIPTEDSARVLKLGAEVICKLYKYLKANKPADLH